MKILTKEEEEHEVVVVLGGENNGAHIRDLIETSQLVLLILLHLVGVDVVRGHYVDAVQLVRCAKCLMLLGSLAVHHMFVLGAEGRPDLISDKVFLC